jgi:hypothetical protein
MSALGQKRKCRSFHVISAVPHKADIDRRDRDVRFVPPADMQARISRCSISLCTNRMFGLVTASQIASASVVSFFCRLT